MPSGFRSFAGASSTSHCLVSCVCGNRLSCNGPVAARRTRSELLHRSCCFHLSRQCRVHLCPLCCLVSQFVVSLLLFSRLLIIFLCLRLFLSFLSLFSSSKIPYYPHMSLLVLFSSQPCLVHLLFFFFFQFSILLFSWVLGVLNFLAWFSSLISLLSSLLVVFPAVAL